MGNLIFRAISEQIPQEILWYIAGQAISSIFSTVGNILNTRQVLLPQSYIKLNMLKSTYCTVHISNVTYMAYTWKPT